MQRRVGIIVAAAIIGTQAFANASPSTDPTLVVPPISGTTSSIPDVADAREEAADHASDVADAREEADDHASDVAEAREEADDATRDLAEASEEANHDDEDDDDEDDDDDD